MLKKLFAVVCISAILLGPTTPRASACCDDFWSCAAAVATAGLSCVIEGLINTVNNLVSKVNQLRDKMNSMAQDTANTAQQGVNDAADQLQSEAAAALDEHKKAAERARKIVQEESVPAFTKSAASSAAIKTAQTGASTSGAATQSPGQQGKTKQSTRTTVQASNAGVANAAPGVVNAAEGGSSRTGMARASVLTLPHELQPADDAAIREQEKRSQVAIADKEKEIAQRKQQIEKSAQEARDKAAQGVNVGLDLASKLAVAPLDTLSNWLKDLLAHPDKIFDPTSIVDAAVDTVANDLSSVIDQVAAAVTADATNSLQSAQPDYDAMETQTSRNRQIADAMEKLHKKRTQGALEELQKLVPPSHFNRTAVDTAVLASGSSRRMAFTSVMSRLSASQRKAVAVPKLRIQEISTTIAQLKTIRSQARSARLTLPTYQKSFGQKFDAYFAGKSAADAARVRDQLIAEARTRFAKDPTTRDSVIKLINDQSGRHVSPVLRR